MLYEMAAIFLIDTPIPILINNNFFFISANSIGMIAGYLLEYTGRRNYYLLRLLEEEKHTIEVTNQALEGKIQELDQASEEIKTLSGFLPICSHCKKSGMTAGIGIK